MIVNYIDGTLKNWTLPQTVERMCQMRYLYEYCDFNDYYQKVHDKRHDNFDGLYDSYEEEPTFDVAERMGQYISMDERTDVIYCVNC